MPLGDSYYFAFNYTCLLFGVTAFGVIICFKRFKKKRGIGFTSCLFLTLIIVDLFSYVILAVPSFSLPRESLRFKEKRTRFQLPASRIERIYEKDQFRYFKPALYEAFTALDARMIYNFDKNYITADLENMAKEVMDGIYPLQEQATRFDTSGFLKYGFVSFDSWNKGKKTAYLNFLEVVLEEFAIKSGFYFAFPGVKENIFLIRKGIEDGYQAVHAGTSSEAIEKTVRGLLDLISFRDQLRLEIENNNYVFYKNQKDMNVGERKKAHQAIFYYISFSSTAADLIMEMAEFYSINDTTFVRFKEYDKMAGLYEPENFHEGLPGIRKRLRRDLGISEPLLRFYNGAEYTDDYMGKLISGDIEGDALYVNDARVLSDWRVFSKDISRSQDVDISIEGYLPDRVELSFFSKNDGYLYFSDGYDKYWEAEVNGKKEPVVLANGLFKAVKVGEGENRVIFMYNPVFFRFSLWLYYLVSAFCLIFLFTGKRKLWFLRVRGSRNGKEEIR
jgi:hypothetical protein